MNDEEKPLEEGSEPTEPGSLSRPEEPVDLTTERIERLKPYRFPKGHSGNPGGKSKILSEGYGRMLMTKITPRMIRALKLPKEFVGLTFRDAIVLGVGGAGARGMTEAAREIADRWEGKVESALRLQNDALVADILAKLWEKKKGQMPDAITTEVLPALEEGEEAEDAEEPEPED